MPICKCANMPIEGNFLFIGILAHSSYWHIIHLDRTSFLINETYDKPKQTTVAATSPVN